LVLELIELFLKFNDLLILFFEGLLKSFDGELKIVFLAEEVFQQSLVGLLHFFSLNLSFIFG